MFEAVADLGEDADHFAAQGARDVAAMEFFSICSAPKQ